MPSKNIFKAAVGIDIMIKFFRHIRQRMREQNRIAKYLLYAIGEIILVVIGILVATRNPFPYPEGREFYRLNKNRVHFLDYVWDPPLGVGGIDENLDHD